MTKDILEIHHSSVRHAPPHVQKYTVNKSVIKIKPETWSWREQTVATVQDYDVSYLLKGTTSLTKMNEGYRTLAWQTRAEVWQVFYDGLQGPYLP